MWPLTTGKTRSFAEESTIAATKVQIFHPLNTWKNTGTVKNQWLQQPQRCYLCFLINFLVGHSDHNMSWLFCGGGVDDENYDLLMS